MFVSLADRIDELPLVLAGPIVRAATPDEVSFWLATRAPGRWRASVWNTLDGDDGVVRASGEAETLPIGKRLHLVLVTARVSGGPLQPGATYAYELEATRSDGEKLSLSMALGGTVLGVAGHERPTFQLPPADLNQVRLAYGSCRKPHGEGEDALADIDDALAESAEEPAKRPQALFLLGDQIYADDVADAFYVLIEDAVSVLFGEEEPPADGSRAFPGMGRRGETAKQARLTSIYADNHLFTYAEFVCMYLFVWSDVLWPSELPVESEMPLPHGFFARRAARKRIALQTPHLRAFRASLGKVRRVLANLPVYMVFDDHDITDDWNLNRGWTRAVLRNDLGRQMVRNGMRAYALCQAWGNVPERFESGPGAELLRLEAETGASVPGKKTRATFERLLGLPGPESDMRDLKRDPRSCIRWDFRVYGPSHEVWVLDTRTWRSFPGAGEDSIPNLLGTAGWDQLAPSARPETELVTVVAPTNVIDLPITAHVSKWVGRLRGAHHGDYGDSWEAQTDSFEHLLSRLSARTYEDGSSRHALVILSGDVHYGFAARIHYMARRPYDEAPFQDGELEAVMAHLTSSSFHNQNGFTRVFHRQGYLPPQARMQAWAGWHERPSAKTTSFRGALKAFFQGFRSRSLRHEPPLLNVANLPRELEVSPAPDWRYRIDYLSGSRVDEEGSPSEDGAGRDIVGVNNFGLLAFDWPADEKARLVRQELWWREGSRPPRPLTVFEAPLAYGEGPPFEQPMVWPGE